LTQYQLHTLKEWLTGKSFSKIVVLTDDNTSEYCLPILSGLLNIPFPHINISQGEHSKSLENASYIWNELLKIDADRNSLLINLGGGMISDIGGFCAASFKRGISFINIPTTLLAMVDAAIGGKTAINIGPHKNQVGLFANPEEVFIDPVFLKTLHEREIISGYAEVYKYGLIYDAAFARKLVNTSPVAIKDWLSIIENCVRIKEDIVLQDPREKGLRKILNFGHTIGHALESYSLEHDTDPLLHGEAVAFGMVAEAWLSHQKTGLTSIELNDLENHIKLVFNPVSMPGFSNKDLFQYLVKDKKNNAGIIRFALLETIGKAVYDIPCTLDEISGALDYCRQRMGTPYSHQIFPNQNKMPDQIKGKVQLPASKSISNRALIIRALCETPFMIQNLSDADDTALMQLLFQSGDQEVYVKNAGTVARFLLAYYASRDSDVIIKGNAFMNERPIGDLVEALIHLGADIEYLENKNRLPVHIHGKVLSGGHVIVPASTSSQFITALLLIGPTLKKGITLELSGAIVSKPYIDLTLQIMNFFGIHYQKEDNIITLESQKYKPKTLFVESDWSAASYFYALTSLFPGTVLEFDHLLENSWQGDNILKDIMKEFGIESIFENNKCRISSQQFKLNYFQYDFIDNPDLIPTFVCLCCALNIPFSISGIKTLKYKESNRAEVLQKELAKLGYAIYLEENIMKSDSIKYQDKISKNKIIILDACQDHRMAMSFSLLALKNPEITINDADSVEKSFPQFWTELENLGITIQKERRHFINDTFTHSIINQ
jgi:3-dehydroquinate synthase/3-phosphoshikimate 1-carboxyvinyltransferase